MFKILSFALLVTVTTGNPVVKVGNGGAVCDECNALVEVLKNWAKGEESTVTKDLEDFCKYVPGVSDQECKAFIDKYATEIFGAIIGVLDPTTICASVCKVGETAIGAGAPHDDCCLNGDCCHGVEYCCDTCAGTCRCSVGGKCSISANLTKSDKCLLGTQKACDADSECTWCTSAAVPSACHTLADAKGLPPAVFKCDKMANAEIVPASTECDVCTDIFKALDDDITNPQYQKEIIDYLIGPFCNSPMDPFKDQCLSIFEEIGGDLLSAVAKELSVKEMCVDLLKLCPSA